MTDTQNPPVDRSNGFAAHIRNTIERLELTDNQAADYFGVPVFTLRKWLNGERAPGAATQKLLDVLGLIEAMAPALHDSLLKGTK
jgi:DNA-binding transcriptional regulator YiaG